MVGHHEGFLTEDVLIRHAVRLGSMLVFLTASASAQTPAVARSCSRELGERPQFSAGKES